MNGSFFIIIYIGLGLHCVDLGMYSGKEEAIRLSVILSLATQRH